MIYEVRLIAYFDDIDPINDIKDKILDHWPEAKVINPNTPDQECSFIDIIENHHDEHPHEPCHLIEHIDNCPLPT